MTTYRFWQEIPDLKYVENNLELFKANLQDFLTWMQD